MVCTDASVPHVWCGVDELVPAIQAHVLTLGAHGEVYDTAVRERLYDMLYHETHHPPTWR